jgi:ketosteroid isomerase-like protein
LDGVELTHQLAEEDHMPADPIDVVLKFEQLINSRDPAAIISLLTTDSVFVDSLGSGVQGLEKLRAAWEGYFKMVPDYTISHDEIFSHGETVALFGSARGTFRRTEENFWKTTAAWRASVKDGKIALWQVFADNEPIRTIMRRTAANE